MIRTARRPRRVLAAVAVTAIAALFVNPASAAPAPGQVEFAGAYAADGYINAAEAAASDPGARPVEWTTPDGSQVGAQGRFTDASDTVLAGTCEFTLPSVSGTGTDGYLNEDCMASAPEGEIRWQVRWWDGSTYTPWSSDSIIVDRVATVAITSPAAGSLNKKVTTIAGTADPNSAIVVKEGTILLGSTTANGAGSWSTAVSLTTGTHVVKATATDPAGNVVTSAGHSFDVDGVAPSATITSPAAFAVFAPNEPVIIEGTAKDGNPEAFGGVLAVEMNIHDPLTLNVRPEFAPTPASLLDDPAAALTRATQTVQLGKVIDQVNATCSGCPSSGASVVTWAYDATALVPGIYTFQVRTFDKAGNSALQPEVITIVRL